jgi:AcrR family transcriptional regulator
LNGVLGDLVVRTGEDRGEPVAIACEALLRDEVAAEAAAAGLMALTPAPNKDTARLPFAPMLYRGRPDAAGASPPANVHLGDQLFVARIARMVRQVAAAIAPETPAGAAREVAHLALAEPFLGDVLAPLIGVEVVGAPPRLVVHVRPRGFRGVRLDEVEIEAPLG